MTVTRETVWDQRSNNFDFLRLALAILVIYSHSYPLGGTPERLEPFMRMTHGQMTGGAVAVNLFFIMSGFLITASAARSRSFFGFMKKRVMRIYPAFIAAAVYTAIFVLPVASATLARSGTPARIENFVVQTLRLREFTYANAFLTNPYPVSINGSIWSVQFEFWCYIGVGLLMVGGLLRKRFMLLAVFLLSVFISVMFLTEGWVFGGKLLGKLAGSPQFWARLLPLYLAGVIFYLFRDRIRHNGWLAFASVIALIAASWSRFGYAAVFPLAGTYLIFYIAFSPRISLRQFGRFGDFSYGTYLYAFPIQQMLMRGFGRPVSPWVLFAWAAPLTVLTAVGSWYGVERRFLRPARRKETVVHALEAAPQSA